MTQSKPVYAIGVDVGGTKVATGLVDTNGTVFDLTTFPTPPSTQMIAAIAEKVALLKASAVARGGEVRAIGMGTAGLVDATRGIVLFASDSLKGWGGTDVSTGLGGLTGLPVLVENDVKALAAGESQFGAGRGFPRGLYVAIGTGIGGAIIADGQVEHGANWSAGEIGHSLVDYRGERPCTCGMNGHLEAYTAGPAMARRYCERKGLPPDNNLRPVAEAARAGDPDAIEAIREGAHILGLALNGAANFVDPDVLVIGGGVPEIGDLWWKPFEAALRSGRMSPPLNVPVRHAELGTSAVMIGAAYLALRRENAR